MGFILFLAGTVCFSQQNFKIIGAPQPGADHEYRIQVGAFRVPVNAEQVFARLKSAGFDPVYENYLNFTRVLLTKITAGDIPSVIKNIETLGFKEVWITENKSAVLLESVIADPYYYTVQVGGNKIINLDAIPANSGASWSSHDTGIAAVDAAGKLTGIAIGSTLVEARYKGTAAAVSVTVVPAAHTYYVSKEEETLVFINENTRATPETRRLSEYRTEPTFRLAYRFVNPPDGRGASGTNGGIDILGKGKSDTWMWTSYHQGGFFYDLNGVRHIMTNGVQSDPNGVILTIEPSFVYIDGIPYLQLQHKLENKSSVRVTGQRFGASSDIMIHNNDHAPLAINSYGVLMTDARDSNIASLNLMFVGKTGQDITPVSSVWIGPWANGDHLDHIYDDGVSGYYYDGVDSAMAFSYQGITLNPGETKYYSVRFTLARNSS
ncbi:MAG: SPOR domain-containing protein [Treponema sp.]|nr:SPOR domain-containing protein [Treponema sp.]